MVSNTSLSSGGWKAGFGVVASVVISWTVVVGRFLVSVRLSPSEFVAQDTNMAIVEAVTRRLFILIEQFSSISEFLSQQDLLPAKAIAAMSAEVANVSFASSVYMKEFLWVEWPMPIA